MSKKAKQYHSVAPHMRDGYTQTKPNRNIEGNITRANEHRYKFYKVPTDDPILEEFRHKVLTYEISSSIVQVAINKSSSMNVYFDHFPRMESFREARSQRETIYFWEAMSEYTSNGSVYGNYTIPKPINHVNVDVNITGDAE